MPYKIKTTLCQTCHRIKNKDNKRPLCGSCSQKQRWNSNSVTTKYCIACSGEISRYTKTNNTLLNPAVYKKRQYCSYKCSGNEKTPFNSLGQKQCKNCQIYKNLEMFYSKRQNGLEKLADCIECISSKASERQKRERIQKLLKNYNISQDQYESILRNQNYRCGICGNTNGNKSIEHLFVDHDHKCCGGRTSCGKCVRGLLCDKCNRGAGFFNDDPELFIIAAQFFAR